MGILSCPYVQTRYMNLSGNLQFTPSEGLHILLIERELDQLHQMLEHTDQFKQFS